jgi:hypothetical protein
VVKLSGSESKKPSGKTIVKPGGKTKDGKEALELDVIQRARASGKPVMFYVHGNCVGEADKACKTMVNLVLRQKAIVKLSKGFHPVEIDASKLTRSLGKRYKLVVSPSVVFVDCRGKVMKTLPGKSSPRLLAAVMKAVIARNTKTLKAEKKSRKKAAS